jgi:hypothetical protein
VKLDRSGISFGVLWRCGEKSEEEIPKKALTVKAGKAGKIVADCSQNLAIFIL